MKYAVRLMLPPIPVFSAGVSRLNRFVGVPIEKGAPNLAVYDLASQQKAAVRQILPSAMQDALLEVSLIRVNQAQPHTHSGTGLTAINWYLETGGETTSFYEGPIHNIARQNYFDTDNGYEMPDPAYLTVAQQFVAKDDEVWMIDVHAPHSVSINPTHPDIKIRYAPTKGRSREALHTTFNLPFAEAAELMKEYIRV